MNTWIWICLKHIFFTTVKVFYVNDHRSYVHNLSSCEKLSLKKFRCCHWTLTCNYVLCLQSSEDTSQTPSAPESSEGSQIRRGHGQGKVSRETSEQGLSSDMVKNYCFVFPTSHFLFSFQILIFILFFVFISHSLYLFSIFHFLSPISFSFPVLYPNFLFWFRILYCFASLCVLLF